MTTTPTTWTPTPTVAPKRITGAWLRRTPAEEQAGVLAWLDGAKRGDPILANLRRLAEGDRLPAHVRVWVDRQGAGAGEAGAAPEAGESPAPTPIPCDVCGKPRTTTLSREGSATRYLCNACYLAEWVCDVCGFTLSDAFAACEVCATRDHDGEAGDADTSPLAPGASTATNPVAPEDAPPPPAPPSCPPREGAPAPGAAGVGLCSCGSGEPAQPCVGCGYAYCASCLSEIGDQCRKPCCAPCEGCGVPVSVVVVSDACPGKRLCGDCESGEGPHAPPATEGPHALVAAANQEAADAYDRLDRERDRSERLLQAVENIGRALVKTRAEARTKGGDADGSGAREALRGAQPHVVQAEEVYSGNLLRLRPSSLDLAMACPASAYDLGPRVEPDTEPARAGSALHELIAQSIRDDRLRMDLLDATCERYELGAPSASDVSRRLRRAWRCWAQDGMSAAFPDAQVEQSVAHTLPGGVEIRGSGDVGALVGSVVRIADWKSGHRLGGHEHQVRSYARGWLDRYPEAERAQAWVIPLEHLEDPRIAREAAHAQTWSREELDQWAERVERRVVGWDRSTYSPGAHCSRCPLRVSCPAHREEAARAAAVLGGAFGGLVGRDLEAEARTAIAGWSDERKVQAFREAGVLRRIASAVEDAVKDEVHARGELGPLVVSEQGRRALLPLEAWPVLAARLPQEDIAAAMSLKLGRLESAVKKRAPVRGGAAAVRELRQALGAAGAVVETTFTRVLDRGEA